MNSPLFRERKSNFIRLFDKTPEGVICPHFYELILSNGCPYDCSYCYLKLTFKGNKRPILFTNRWQEIEKELSLIPKGNFVTGILADSLAIAPPNLEPALKWFSSQRDRYLILVTKSTNIKVLLTHKPSPQVVVSFSINSMEAWSKYERLTPDPIDRVKAAARLKEEGWRIRIRLDPIILNGNDTFTSYKEVCQKVAELAPEMVTIGTLRPYRGLYRFSPIAPRYGLKGAVDGRMRYLLEVRVNIYDKIAKWLGFQPSLCKETTEVQKELGWTSRGCNCIGTEETYSFEQMNLSARTADSQYTPQHPLLFQA
jgi:spore photoproduct lyase